ncbi:MAG: hypothetical protein KA746_07735 [Pyrinomonadaceae bacterium]|nr:hypothetical protein [Pyrinomonadaceae bacterium]
MLTDEDIEGMLADEDFDISAVYDLGKGGLCEDFSFTSPAMTERFRVAFENGMKKASRKHKEAGVPMVVLRDGKIAYIQPEEIEID